MPYSILFVGKKEDAFYQTGRYYKESFKLTLLKYNQHLNDIAEQYDLVVIADELGKGIAYARELPDSMKDRSLILSMPGLDEGYKSLYIKLGIPSTNFIDRSYSTLEDLLGISQHSP